MEKEWGRKEWRSNKIEEMRLRMIEVRFWETDLGWVIEKEPEVRRDREREE